MGSKQRIFMPVGGTGGGPVAKPFRGELWQYVLANTVPVNSKLTGGLLTTPSRLCGDLIEVNELVSNHESIEKDLGCTFHLLNEDLFAQGRYDGQFDILCITCGNTAGARALWKINGGESIIEKWYRDGVVCTGYSAGFILFYDWASTDSVPGPSGAQFGVMSGMGLIKGGAIPHADTQARRVPDFQMTLREKSIDPVLALGEEVMALYINEELLSIVSPAIAPRAFFVERDQIQPLTINKI